MKTGEFEMISVAMTTYNGSKYLHEQIDSILNQSEKDFELVICDDCSSDDTLDILYNYAKNDSRVHVFENEKNLGYVKNFEKAITLCKGDYIALSDQDDIWLPEHLSVLFENIKSGGYSLVGANALLVDSNNNDLGSKLINNNTLPNDKSDFETMLLYRNVFQGAAILFDKAILDKALPFPENMKYHDWWLALVASENNGVNYVDVPILRYRQHGNNASGNHEKDSLKTKLTKFFASDLKETGIRNIIILEKFINCSNKKEKVSEALDFAKYCEAQKMSAVRYFRKHNKEIYFGESSIKTFIRTNKMMLNVFFGKKR